MNGRGAMRASDADRERAAERLHAALTEGRLHTEEFEQRLEASFSARTYAQLDAVLADLPGRRLAAGPARRRAAVGTVVPRPVSPVLDALVIAAGLAITVAAIAAIVLLATGVFAAWMLWLLAGWLFFGHRGRRRRLLARGHEYRSLRGDPHHSHARRRTGEHWA